MPAPPTDEQLREIVLCMAIAGVPKKLIAKAINSNEHSLRDKYPDELDHGKALCASDAVKALMANVRAGKEASIFFYLKTQCGWREVNRTELTGADGEPLGLATVSAEPLTEVEWAKQYGSGVAAAGGSAKGSH